MRQNNLTKQEKILRLPSWIKFPISKASEFEKIQTLIKKSNIHTICEEARCPNRAECYASGTATFLLGGSICSLIRTEKIFPLFASCLPLRCLIFAHFE